MAKALCEPLCREWGVAIAPEKVGFFGAGGAEEGTITPEESSELESTSERWCWGRFIGPGLLVCLADTDAGCLIVAAQSGARWGYSLFGLQVVLIPALFLAQELTIRLGVHTKQGHTACIREHFGIFWAVFACVLLVLECFFALISEVSGISEVGEIWGMSRHSSTLFSVAVIFGVVCKCSYRQVEAIAIAFGLFELTFVFTMFIYHPDPMDVLTSSFDWRMDPTWLGLVSSNIGAVIMPWMIYFQQSAVVARNQTTQRFLKEEQINTFLGSVLTQVIMIGSLVTLAAVNTVPRDLTSVADIALCLAPALGILPAKIFVSLAFVGGSLCAAFVVALAASWAVCEVLAIDARFSVDRPPVEAPQFYLCFILVLSLSATVLMSGVDVVKLNVCIELLDGLLLPFAVGFLYLLATGEALPESARVVGLHKYVVFVLFSCCCLVSLVSGCCSLLNPAGL